MTATTTILTLVYLGGNAVPQYNFLQKVLLPYGPYIDLGWGLVWVGTAVWVLVYLYRGWRAGRRDF